MPNYVCIHILCSEPIGETIRELEERILAHTEEIPKELLEPGVEFRILQKP